MRPTLFEKTRPALHHHTAKPVALPEALANAPSRAKRSQPLGLPEISEVEVVRHYTNLTRENYGVDSGSYPLGSCTMKYNPKRHDACAELDGFRDVHPKQPTETLTGVWKMLHHLQKLMAEITGMDAVSLQPAAGAHGELAGLLIIRKYLEEKGELDQRNIILIADSAHGTNPASATMAGFDCRIVATNALGMMDMDDLRSKIDGKVAGIMLTNPSTLGLFEENILEIATLVHDNGGLLYYDGANLNALIGMYCPGDMGFDIIHVNTHKTFSTPHGGGGPGAGPVGVKAHLAQHLPTYVAKNDAGDYAPYHDDAHSIGPMKAGFGHIDVLVRAYAYILTIGKEQIAQISQDAVLNANYLQAELRDYVPPVFDKLCMHECLLNADKLPISAYTLAKRMIDFGVHPPTLVGAGCVYFSDDLKSAMLIEPTETESKEELDILINLFKKIIVEADKDIAFVESAPHSTAVSKIPLENRKIIEA